MIGVNNMERDISTIKNRIRYLVFAGFTVLVVLYSSASAGEWQELIGKEVIFMEREKSLQNYDYSVFRKPDIGPGLPYKDYVGKRGKILRKVDTRSVFSFWEIQLETGEMVYVQAFDSDRNDLSFYLPGLYFMDDYNEAKEKIGKFVWINQNRGKTMVKQRLITEDSNVSYALDHLEKVKVIDVFTKSLGHSYGSNPFFLKLQKSTGEVGFIGYNSDNYFGIDPVDPSWDKSILETIKQQKIRLGMTREQVLLSWGKPKDVNTTVTLYGTKEEWIYDKKKYLYFEDNKLTTFQY